MFGANKFGWLKHPGYNGGGDSGGGSSGTQTTVQKADPWEGVQPYLTSAYETASNLYGPESTGPALYEGQYTVDPDPLRTQAQDYQQWWATSQLPQNISDINTAYGRLLNAPNVENNPWLQGAANAAIQPIMQQYQENILPGIRSGAMQSGQYGGSRQGVAEGIAAGRTSQAIGDTTSRIYADAYNQGMESLAKGLSFSPTFLDIGMKPASSLYDLATQKENIAQTDLNEAIKRWEYEQGLPYNQLNDYLALLNGAQGGTSTSNTTGTQPNYGGGDSTLGTIGGLLSLVPSLLFSNYEDN
ncbi:MAG: hypothetical protein HQK87_10710 [Nitrospinae bacterium]|nr:hypothetical protein [Nitrospinota bacterium]